jgi:hypothetical protein
MGSITFSHSMAHPAIAKECRKIATLAPMAFGFLLLKIEWG